MLDVAVSYNRFKFLGHEFLTWLWFVIENQPDKLKASDSELVFFQVGDRIVLENSRKDTVESVTIKGDEAGLEEGALALQKGAVVTELNLIYKSSAHEWRFSLKGESLGVSGLKTPQIGLIEHDEDIEGALLDKVYLFEKAIVFINNLYADFIRLRVSDRWENDEVPHIRKWVAS